MCFGSPGPSAAEREAARAQRESAEQAKQEAIAGRAEQKREDIQSALEGSVQRRGMRGGSGRRSLFRAQGGGFMGRFG